MKSHQHKCRFETEKVNLHNHKIMGHTDYMVGINSLHFHFFYGISSYNGHTHYYSGITGLPVKTENGHKHKIEGVLETNNLHEHPFENYTFEDIEYISGKKTKAAYI